MKFTQFLGPVAALVSLAAAEEVTVTTVVDEYVTYCPVSSDLFCYLIAYKMSDLLLLTSLLESHRLRSQERDLHGHH